MQEGVGSGGGDTASAGYQAKAAVGDPGVSESQSANYVYDHGTLWFDDGFMGEPEPAPEPAPTGGDGSGANSGSGWFGSLFGGNTNPQVGGEAPDTDVPFTDTPAVAAAIGGIPQAGTAAVHIEDAPAAIEYAVAYPQPAPKVIRLVDDKGVVREVDIVLLKRITPWPLWIALLFVVLGGAVLLVFAIGRGVHPYLLWVAGGLIMAGIIAAIVVRMAYHASPIDTKAITSINVMPLAETDAAVKKLMEELPLGVHVIEATAAAGKKVLTVKVFITPALPL